MEREEFPPEEMVKAIIEENLPEGVRLKGISFTFDTLAPGKPEGWVVIAELIEDDEAWRTGSPGLAYNITQYIRRRWSRDDLYVKIRIIRDEVT